MILVDSSVWIDYFRAADTPQVALLDSCLGNVLLAVGDLIAAEVLQGVRAPIDGIGIAMGRTSYVPDDIAKGRLVVPFKIALPADAGLSGHAAGTRRFSEALCIPVLARRRGAYDALMRRTQQRKSFLF